MAFEAVKQAVNATSWDEESYGIYFTMDYNGQEINGNFEHLPQELEKADTAQFKKVVQAFADLDKRAFAFIKESLATAEGGEDIDVESLELTELMFYTDGSFSLGYYAGESDAGDLFIFVAFNSDFTMGPELIYEVF